MSEAPALRPRVGPATCTVVFWTWLRRGHCGRPATHTLVWRPPTGWQADSRCADCAAREDGDAVGARGGAARDVRAGLWELDVAASDAP